MKIAIENLNRVKTIKQFTHKKLAEKNRLLKALNSEVVLLS